MRGNTVSSILLSAVMSAGLTVGIACDRVAPGDASGSAAGSPSGGASASTSDHASGNPASPAPNRSLVANAPLPTSVLVTPLADLSAPDIATLAVVPTGDVYLVQGSGDVQVLQASTGATMKATSLTAARVLEGLGIGSTEAARGRFAAIAGREDGQLAFCFAGVNGSQPIAAIGTFDPRADRVFITIDQISINNAVERHLPEPTTLDTDLSSDTSRPSLFTSGDRAWLWRAGEKYIRLLAIDQFGQLQPTLTPVRISLQEIRDVVERSTWEWSATTTPGEFFLTDTVSRWIRRIDTKGQISHVARFDETVATISPATFDAAGRLLVLGCDRDGVVQGLLIQKGDVFTGIARDQFTGPGVSPDTLLRFDRLHALPNTPNAFVAYEATTGRVVRVELR
jgi:hypothetical protein